MSYLKHKQSTVSCCAFGCNSLSSKGVHVQTIFRRGAAPQQPRRRAASRPLPGRTTQSRRRKPPRRIGMAKVALHHASGQPTPRRAGQNSGGEGEREDFGRKAEVCHNQEMKFELVVQKSTLPSLMLLLWPPLISPLSSLFVPCRCPLLNTALEPAGFS